MDDLPDGREDTEQAQEYARMYFMEDVNYEIYGWWNKGENKPIGIGGLVLTNLRAEFFS